MVVLRVLFPQPRSASEELKAKLQAAKERMAREPLGAEVYRECDP